MKLLAIEKAVHKKRTPSAAAVKSEPLSDDLVIIDDDEDVKPIVVHDAAEVKTDSTQPCVEMKPLQFKPVWKKPPTARKGRSFRCPSTTRQDVMVKTVDIPNYNEITAAQGLVGLSDEQPKTGYLCNL